MPTRPVLHRRSCLALAAAPLLAPLLAHSQTIPNVTGEELEAMNLSAAGVTLEFPSLADTGFAVPIHADIVAPAGLNIETIEVFLPANPNTRALKLRLPQPVPSYTFSTRLRLAGSQSAWVVASLSDGSRIGASAPTVVTSSACFDGT